MKSRNNVTESNRWDQSHLANLITELSAIHDDLLAMERYCDPLLTRVEPSWRVSAINLMHYLALRRHDIRPLQGKLANLGLSSLGRAEGHVMASVFALLKVLKHLAGLSIPTRDKPGIDFNDGKLLLEQNTERLLGLRPCQRGARIMVTMPSEAAEDYLLVRELLNNGMNCMRINCAHDDEEKWAKMVANLRRAKRETGKKCRVLMDLAGPKLRTGPLEPGPEVIKWRPLRDPAGNIREPARIWLMPDGSGEFPDGPADAVVPLSSPWLATLKVDDDVIFTDARGATRRLKITGQSDNCWWAEARSTAYVTSGTLFRAWDGSDSDDPKLHHGPSGSVGRLQGIPGMITLHLGDPLILTRDLAPGHGAVYDDRSRLVSPATIGCTLAEVFEHVRPGERIWFDDGKIGGIIRSVHAGRIKVEIASARLKGERLAAEKGINLPDSRLDLPALTGKDREDLRFIVGHAHMVGMSFVQEVDDVAALQAQLHELGGEHLGIVLKIETRRGFEMLPDLVLAAMRSHAVGVMIARGDLAVECGYDRLAEVQEEILWICEAAHIPVIWATQVLESLAKSGMPSRAEITDAAMGERAECVMLNKGPHISKAIQVLDNILQRMEAHQNKKSPLLRQLRWWEQLDKHCRNA